MKLPAILGWLIACIVFGPCLAGIVAKFAFKWAGEIKE